MCLVCFQAKCLTAFKGSKWLGHWIRLEVAKPDYLHRLENEWKWMLSDKPKQEKYQEMIQRGWKDYDSADYQNIDWASYQYRFKKPGADRMKLTEKEPVRKFEDVQPIPLNEIDWTEPEPPVIVRPAPPVIDTTAYDADKTAKLSMHPSRMNGIETRTAKPVREKKQPVAQSTMEKNILQSVLQQTAATRQQQADSDNESEEFDYSASADKDVDSDDDWAALESQSAGTSNIFKDDDWEGENKEDEEMSNESDPEEEQVSESGDTPAFKSKTRSNKQSSISSAADSDDEWATLENQQDGRGMFEEKEAEASESNESSESEQELPVVLAKQTTSFSKPTSNAKPSSSIASTSSSDSDSASSSDSESDSSSSQSSQSSRPSQPVKSVKSTSSSSTPSTPAAIPPVVIDRETVLAEREKRREEREQQRKARAEQTKAERLAATTVTTITKTTTTTVTAKKVILDESLKQLKAKIPVNQWWSDEEDENENEAEVSEYRENSRAQLLDEFDVREAFTGPAGQEMISLER